MFGRDLKHTYTGLDRMTIGPEASFSELVGAAFQTQRDLESAFGFEYQVQESYYDELKKAGIPTPKFPQLLFQLDPVTPSSTLFKAAINRALGENPYKFGPLPSTALPGQIDEWLKSLDETDKALTKVGAGTFADVVRKEGAKRKALRAELEGIQARGGGASSLIAELVGGFAGSFDPLRDPILFGSVFIPIGQGGHLARLLALEALIGAGSEAVQQKLFVVPRAEALGEETHALMNILFAAGGAAAFRGLFEGAERGARTLYERIEHQAAPQQWQAKKFAEALEEALGTTVDVENLRRPLTDEQLRAAVKKLAEDERVGSLRSALDVMEADEITMRYSPYPYTNEGVQLTQAAVEDFSRQFEGLPGGERAYESLAPEVRLLGVDIAAQKLARAENPDLFARVDELQEELDSLSDQLKDVGERIRTSTIGDAVFERIDEAEGDALRVAESQVDRLRRGTPERVEAEADRDAIITQLGPENVARAVQEYNLGLREEQRGLRAQRGRLQGERRELAEAAVEAENRAAQQVPNLRTQQQLAMETLVEDMERLGELVDYDEYSKLALETMRAELDFQGIRREVFRKADIEKRFTPEDGKKPNLVEAGQWWKGMVAQALRDGDKVRVKVGGEWRVIDGLTAKGATAEGRQVNFLSLLREDDAEIEVIYQGAAGQQLPPAPTTPKKITQNMRKDLRNLEFTDQQIDQMQVNEAVGMLRRNEIPVIEKTDEAGPHPVSIDGVERRILSNEHVVLEEGTDTVENIVRDLEGDRDMVAAVNQCLRGVKNG